MNYNDATLYASVHMRDETPIKVSPMTTSDGFMVKFDDVGHFMLFLTPASARNLFEQLRDTLELAAITGSRAVPESIPESEIVA